MNKKDFLKAIAERGYDVGFGAKKHFATFDIIDKIPGLIGFLSISFGIISLAITDIESNFVSAIFIMLGVASLYVGFYNHSKEDYRKSGEALLQIYYSLKNLYLTVKDTEDAESLAQCQKEFSELEKSMFLNSISKQILLSGWAAHYKFFWELQIAWIEEQREFRFFRDKIPLSLTISIVAVVIGLILYACCVS
ncbi:MAG: SLATT domain-containing protein [Pseudomonadales bacterium]|nr:SLATT domain-containing protein [Pseudomonadales bacterium]